MKNFIVLFIMALIFIACNDNTGPMPNDPGYEELDTPRSVHDQVEVKISSIEESTFKQ